MGSPQMAKTNRRPVIKKKAYSPPVRSEESEQIALCKWLDFTGANYCHVPNGGLRSRLEAVRFKRMGVRPGMPDILIFSVPVGLPCNGVAIELKRRQGGRVTPVQKLMLERLEEDGWITRVCRGSDEAIDFLTGLGYSTSLRVAAESRVVDGS